jgi:hypothetical protein
MMTKKAAIEQANITTGTDPRVWQYPIPPLFLSLPDEQT